MRHRERVNFQKTKDSFRTNSDLRELEVAIGKRIEFWTLREFFQAQVLANDPDVNIHFLREGH